MRERYKIKDYESQVNDLTVKAFIGDFSYTNDKDRDIMINLLSKKQNKSYKYISDIFNMSESQVENIINNSYE